MTSTHTELKIVKTKPASPAKELIVINEESVLEAYSNGTGLEGLIKDITENVNNFEHDLKTAAGRQKTVSLSAKISKAKVKLDNIGKDLTVVWREKTTLVNKSRSDMREKMEALKIQALEPLTEWKAEKAKKEADEEAKIAAQRLAEKRVIDHELGLLLNEKRDRDIADEIRAQAEQAKQKKEADEAARLARDKQIAADAIAQVELDKAALVKEAADAKERARQAEEIAAKAKENAEANQKIQQQLEADRVRLAEEKRLLDRDHVVAVWCRIKEGLMETCGLEEEKARDVVRALNSDKIPDVKITY